jgi:hypothetical protein
VRLGGCAGTPSTPVGSRLDALAPRRLARSSAARRRSGDRAGSGDGTTRTKAAAMFRPRSRPSSWNGEGRFLDVRSAACDMPERRVVPFSAIATKARGASRAFTFSSDEIYAPVPPLANNGEPPPW